MSAERLHKVLAARGIASRRKAEQLIREGRVTVNGTQAVVGVSVDPLRDVIHVDKKQVGGAPNKAIYLVCHKPRGVVSTTQDDRGRPTVIDLVPEAVEERLVLAGRLDYQSEGLILLTNDGELVYALTHPSHELPKTYQAKVRGRPSEAKLDRLRAGIRLEDGPTRPAHVEVLGPARTNTWIEITITEGRNRQVRRMFDAIRHPVQRLVRVGMAGLGLGELAPGEVRALTPEEAKGLRDVAGLDQGKPKKRRSKRKRQVAPRSRPQ